MAKDTKDATAEKGPDNNKRLAGLEAKFSTLTAVAMALVARFAPDMEVAPGSDEDPVDHSLRLLASLETAETPCQRQIAELETEKATTRVERDKLAECIVEHTDETLEGGAIAAAIRAIEIFDGNGATAGELAAIARAEAAEKRVAELEALQADGGSDPLEEAPAPDPKERPAAARDVGPTFGQVDRVELDKIIAEGGPLELVFSNGEYEILDFEPIPIEAKDIPVLAGKHNLTAPIFVRGGGNDDRIAGAGLLLDGEQIAYCPFPVPLAIEKGQERRFEKMISFG